MISLAEIWNAVAMKENKPPQKRDYVYASEIKMPLIDRYLKMTGVPETNPPNPRSLRKFWSGGVWEYVVKTVLDAAGVFHSEQIKADARHYSDCLPVHGRIDFTIGGKYDAEKALANIGKLPDFLQEVAANFIKQLGGEGIEMERRVLEIKSCSQYVLDYTIARRAALVGHQCQSFHYGKTLGMPASVAYISKDTSLMAEYMTPASTEAHYREDLKQITHYFTKREQPPPEPHLLFDYAECKFSKNVGIEWSPYLTMIYGFESPMAYRNSVEKTIRRWNTALDSFASVAASGTTKSGKEKKLTDLQKQSAAEIVAAGYDFDNILSAKIESNKCEIEL